MRLSLIFLGVLAASVLVTALAAWGITYGTSYGRVTTMASEFTTLAHGVLDEFSSFVGDLIQGNAALVNSILTQQRVSGEARMQQTKADMISAVGTLVNYTTNATVQSQVQMNQVVDTFAGLMGSVVGDFRTLTTAYASQLRASLAERAGTVMNFQLLRHISSMLRYLVLQDLEVLNFSRTPWDSIGRDDCIILGAVCATMQELSDWDQFTLALATGRYYNCTASGGSINLLTKNGSVYNEDRVTWLPYNASVPASTQKSMKQRCLTEAPGLVERMGQRCPLPQGCGCGIDQRCEAWYRLHVNDTNPSLDLASVIVGPTGIPYNSFSLSLTDPSTAAVLAVLHVNIPFAWIEWAMSGLGSSNTTLLAIMFNDPVLSMVALLGRHCGDNEARPGDPSLPFYSAVRTCDPDVRWISTWIYQNRAAALQHPAGLVNNGVAWDVYQFNTGGVLMVVGAQLAEINGPIDASNARATTVLAAVRAQQLSQVAASGAATRAYVAAVGAQNIATTQAMEASFAAQIKSLENSSRTALAASQQSSSSHVEQLTAQQTVQIDGLKTKHLSAMSTTAAWTVGVVFAILLAVLLASAWGTVKVTLSLIGIIHLMEDAADMKVENLEVPQHSSVEEVARIQTAFQVLIRRLAEYKSYIPAGLFEQMQEETSKGEGGGAGSDHESVSDQGSSRHLAAPTREERRPSKAASHLGSRASRQYRASVLVVRKASTASSMAHVPRKPTQSRKNVVVLAVNVMGFMEVLSAVSEGNSKGLYNDYVAVVHEAVSQHRGNVDCILGDQVFATFNAHIPCADSAGAAATAAVEMRRQLLHKVGDKMKFQIGVSFGLVFAGSVGYVMKFKSMVTVGSPMRIAALLSRLPRFQGGTVLVDAALEDRVKFAFTLRPAELVHMPTMKTFANPHNATKKQRVFALHSPKEMQEDEWMYQLHEGDGAQKGAAADLGDTFEQLVAAKSVQEGQHALQQFLVRQPTDEVALRLNDRLPLWVPGLGVPL